MWRPQSGSDSGIIAVERRWVVRRVLSKQAISMYSHVSYSVLYYVLVLCFCSKKILPEIFENLAGIWRISFCQNVICCLMTTFTAKYKYLLLHTNLGTISLSPTVTVCSFFINIFFKMKTTLALTRWFRHVPDGTCPLSWKLLWYRYQFASSLSNRISPFQMIWVLWRSMIVLSMSMFTNILHLHRFIPDKRLVLILSLAYWQQTEGCVVRPSISHNLFCLHVLPLCAHFHLQYVNLDPTCLGSLPQFAY